MGCQNQCVVLVNVVLQLCNNAVGVFGSCNYGMAVMSQHMGVNRIDFGNFHIKGFRRLLDDKINAADVDFAFLDNICNLMNGVVENFAESRCEIVDQRFAAVR